MRPNNAPGPGGRAYDDQVKPGLVGVTVVLALGAASAANAQQTAVPAAGHVQATLLSETGASPPLADRPSLRPLPLDPRALREAKRAADKRGQGTPSTAP